MINGHMHALAANYLTSRRITSSRAMSVSHGARIHTSRSSSAVRITGMAFGGSTSRHVR